MLTVYLKSGTEVQVEADTADWAVVPIAPRAKTGTIMLVCKRGQDVRTKFKDGEVAGFSIDS